MYDDIFSIEGHIIFLLLDGRLCYSGILFAIESSKEIFSDTFVFDIGIGGLDYGLDLFCWGVSSGDVRSSYCFLFAFLEELFLLFIFLHV